MRFGTGHFVFAICLAAALSGCTQQQQSPEDLKKKTAKETAALKRDAKAVAQGIREGWNRDQSSVDINSAPKEQLVSAGLSSTSAERVINGRHYNSIDDLVDRHIVSRAEFDRAANHLMVKK